MAQNHKNNNYQKIHTYSTSNTFNTINNNSIGFSQANYNKMYSIDYNNKNNLNDSGIRSRYPNSNFDFDKKMDYLLLTNAFTKLRNENKTYEELENFALKLEISNIKYSQKHENMKFEILRLNQKIIDLNSIIKESEIETKKLLNQLSFLEKDREMILTRLNTHEINFFNSEMNSTKMNHNQINEPENNLLDSKYLIRSSNDRITNNQNEVLIENSKEIPLNKPFKNKEKDLKRSQSVYQDESEDNKNNINKEKKNYESIIEDSDSSLIEGFENNESILDSIKRRENSESENDNKEIKFNWKKVVTCQEKEKKAILKMINNYDSIKKENKKLLENQKNLKDKLDSMSSENKKLERIIKEKDEIIQILYQEIENLKEDEKNIYKKIKNKNRDEFNKESEINEISDITPTTPDADSKFNSPALKKINHFIRDNSYARNIKINSPCTVNKKYFYKNNTNYGNFLKKNNKYHENYNTNSSELSFNNNNFKINSQLNTKNKIKKNYSKNDTEECDGIRDYNNNSSVFFDRPKSTHLSKNNLTFQEHEIIRQNDSGNFNNKYYSELVLKSESDKKNFLSNLEDLKKDLDLFLRDYGIKEQFCDNSNSISNNCIDFLIEYKFKEIRYITVNLKKINIIFKSLFVEFTKNMASNLDKINEIVNKKLYQLQHKISFATGEITASILNN